MSKAPRSNLNAIELNDGGSIQPPNTEGTIHVLDEHLDVVRKIKKDDPEWEDYLTAFIEVELEGEVVRH